MSGPIGSVFTAQSGAPKPYLSMKDHGCRYASDRSRGKKVFFKDNTTVLNYISDNSLALVLNSVPELASVDH
jgi:hypothetical protein